LKEMVKKIIAITMLITIMLSLTACDINQIKDAMMLLKDAEKNMQHLLDSVATNETRYQAGDYEIVVCDKAELVSEDEEKRMVDSLSQLAIRAKCDVLLVTTTSASMTASTYGGAYIDRLFPDGTDSAIAVIMDTANREYWLYVDGEASNKITDGHIDRALDAGSDWIWNKKNYARGFEEIFKYCLKQLAGNTK
jgi:uncharacterized membrane protein YgcG